MPVTFTVASHPAESVSPTVSCSTADALLQRTWTQTSGKKKVKEVLQSSLSGNGHPPFIQAQRNGFVHTIVDAYNQHHHLVLRPDDVWTAILSQFNLYVNAHAEKLRSKFVPRVGQKELVVEAIGTRHTVDFGPMTKVMTDQIDQNIVDKSLKDWILPDFTTTTNNDTIVCAVLMMSTLKAYFSYGSKLACGIPSITLLGVVADWESLVRRLDKLSTFDIDEETERDRNTRLEPTAFATLLRPILNRFVQTFKNAENDDPQDIDFWGRVCHYNKNASGPTYLCGWITAFCVWNSKGEWIGPTIIKPGPGDNSTGLTLRATPQYGDSPLLLDDVPYASIDIKIIPAGYCEVDLKLDDNGNVMDCIMVSGLMGSKIGGERQDTLSPFSTWAIFVTKEV